MLTSLLRIAHPSPTEEPEDVFTAALGTIFTDDLRNQHGDPGAVITYLSRKLGACSPDPADDEVRAVELTLADPAGEEERRKFAHYLWNAGVLMAELVGGRPDVGSRTRGGRRDEVDGTAWRLEGGREWWVGEAEEAGWSVGGERVLELGAGVGLAGIVSTLAGAEEVVISDYPAPEILENLERNVKKNVPENLRSKVSVQGHLWGDLTSPFAAANAGRFTRILAADCLWMPQEHRSLAKSMLHFLSPSPDAKVFVIAGFHTGRANMAPFFTIVEEEGLEIEEIFEMDAEGRRREWAFERDAGREDHGERKKWLVLARLKRKV